MSTCYTQNSLRTAFEVWKTDETEDLQQGHAHRLGTSSRFASVCAKRVMPGVRAHGLRADLHNRKTCPKCKTTKPIRQFVDICGFPNPRGKYCLVCFKVCQQEHARSILEGRDFCLYCGRRITKLYDWNRDRSPRRTYVNRDHMDPLSLGGSDSDRNTVYCCVECNQRKKDKTFLEWLSELKPPYRRLARQVYVRKHRRAPDRFVPTSHEIVLTFNVNDVLAKFRSQNK